MALKKGLSQIILRGSLKECLELTKATGYEGIELVFRGEGELNWNASASDLERIGQMCTDAGIVPCSICGGGGTLTSPKKDEREAGKESVTKVLQCAAALNINAILVVPGSVNEKISYDVAYYNALESCKELAPVAEELKVAIGIENVWNKLFLSPLEMRDFLDEIDSPYVGQYFDIGNVVIFGYPEQWINILGSRIKKIHLKDFKREGYQWPLLMEGDVNWSLVMKAIRDTGYDDFLISEVGGDAEVHKNTSETIDKILEL